MVSDGTVMVTLWRVANPSTATPFDRRANVGLHHLALAVPDETTLMSTYAKVSAHSSVEIEYAPGPVGPGTDVKHFICQMPGGLRLEFIPRA